MHFPHRRSSQITFLVVLIALTLLFVSEKAFASLGDNWTPTIDISNIPVTPPFSFSPTVESDRQGNVHAVWVNSVSVPVPPFLPDMWQNTIYYTRNDGAGFSPPIPLATYQHRFFPYPINIVFDANDYPWIFWIGTEATYVRWDGTAWSAPQTLSFLPLFRLFGSQFEGRTLTATSDQSGKIFVVVGSNYESGPAGLMFTSFDGTGWSTPTLVSDQVGSQSGLFRIDYGSPKIAVDSHSHVHLVWVKTYTTQILYSKYDGISWSTPQVVFESAEFQGPPEIAVDFSDQPHVVWDSYINSFYVVGKYSTLVNSAWTAPESFGAITNGSSHLPKIKCDSAGNAHVIYLEHHGDNTPPMGVFHIQRQQNSWTSPTLISNFFASEVRFDYDAIHNALHAVWSSYGDGPAYDIFYSRTIPSDLTPPVSTANLDGVRGTNGWFIGDVTVSINSTDNEGGTGVKKIHYSVNGSEFVTSGAITSFVVSSECVNTITYYAEDNTGNIEAAQSLSISVDKSPPTPSLRTLPSLSGQCSVSISSPPTASDNCGGQVIGITSDAINYSAQGTFTVHWVYADGHGNTFSQTQTVIVNDTTPPKISCPAALTVEFSSDAGASVTPATPSATDNCGVAVNGTRSDDKSVSALYPLGTTTVTWTASDAANNKTSCPQLVTVLGARGVKQDVLNEMAALRATITNKQDREELSDAIHELAESLSANLWIDETHLKAEGGEKAFDEEKEAVRELLELHNHKKSKIDATTLLGFVNRIIRADRLLASVAISDALAGHGDPRDIARAKGKLGEGDRDIAAGRFEGIADYRDAWKLVLRSKPESESWLFWFFRPGRCDYFIVDHT